MTLKIPDDSYITSDTHFGHKRILEYQPNRIFHTVEQHDAYMVKVWNTIIPPKATVFHLGDFFFYRRDSDLLSKLHGNITLIKGNHDNNKLPIPTLDYLEVKYKDINIVLCHFPIESWTKMTHGSMHFHGHTHGRSRKLINRYDVGVDTNALLRPYSFQEFVECNVNEEKLKRIFDKPYR